MKNIKHYIIYSVDWFCLFYLIAFISCNGPTESGKPTTFSTLGAEALGINFANTLTYTEDFNAYLYRSFYNGAGTGLADFNNDGFLDLFFCGNQVDNALYLGDGNFHFKDITQKAGVASPNAWSTGVSILDINQDGWLDIYVCKSGDPKDKNRRNELFINTGLNAEGVPVFKESAASYGIDDLGFSIHAVFFDYDRDGDLDMYLSNNSINPTDLIMDARKGLRQQVDSGGGDKLYRNDNNFFTNVSEEAGIYSSAIGFGLGISVGDVNRDGWPDIYVANDFFEKDYLYLNNQDGTFSESIAQVTGEISLGSMGVDMADMNHDGYPEIFVTEMLPKDEVRLKTKTLFDDWDTYTLKIKNGYHHQFPRNVFQLNNGTMSGSEKVSFSEIGRYAGVEATDWSWGVQMMDLDLDGNNEIFVTNGIAKDLLDQDYINFYYDPIKIRKTLKEKGAVIKELIDQMPSQPISNHLYKQIDYLKYKDMAADWGLEEPGFSSGSAYGDIDNDGDLDLVVNNINAPPFIYRNEVVREGNHFVNLAVKNKEKCTAIGAQVTLKIDGKVHYKELYPMRGVMSVVDDRLHFGVGKAATIDTLEIVWPDGTKILDENVKTDSFLVYVQPESVKEEEKFEKRYTRPFFVDSTNELLMDHAHIENNFVDFDREKLLYHMVSNEGPKIAIADINNDGFEDFFIGGAKDTPGALYIWNKTGFKKSNEEIFLKDKASEDMHALFFDADNDKDLDLLVSSGSNEFSSSSFALVDRLYLNQGDGTLERSSQILPTNKPVSTAVVINADFDLDGDEDLFFGGRLKPSAYGVPSSSYLLENDGQGNFSEVTSEKASGLLNLGMVTDAVWMDYDRDNDQDLIIVGEWMPVRVFANDMGKFSEVTEQMGLKGTNGFWNTLEKRDLDGDGNVDLIVGNIGENTMFKATPDQPVRMYVNDFDNNGDIEQIITTYWGEESYPMVLKKELTAQMPHLLKKYLKYAEYTGQTIDDIFTEDELKNTVVHEVFQNKSMVLWNEGDKFTTQELPWTAQLAPIYAIYAEDLDKDGHVDLILGGNQYNAKPQTGIYSGSYGTVLKSLGNRQFKTMDFASSGFQIKGQIRDMQEIMIKDKKHLIIARNNDKVKMYTIANEDE